jgi:hypothetical protein
MSKQLVVRSAAAVLLSVGLMGGNAFAQGSAALYPQSWQTCNAQEQAGIMSASTNPALIDARSKVPVGQWIWVRWTLYRSDNTFPATGRTAVQQSNWWKGVATPTSGPAQWYEYTWSPLAGRLVYTGRTTLYNPSWSISLRLSPSYGSTLYALMEFQWQPLSTTTAAWPSKVVWASGSCNWPLPH